MIKNESTVALEEENKVLNLYQTKAAHKKREAFQEYSPFIGWLMGFEPTTNGTTNHYSNQLSYSHRFKVMQNYGFLDNLEKYFHIFICSCIHILGWCLKMRLLPHVLFSLGWDWSLICSHVQMVCFAALNTMFISWVIA